MSLPTDGDFTDEQQKIAASLSPEFIEKIDASLLSHATTLERKVAMIFGLAMMGDTIRVAGLPDLFYRDRVKFLVARGLLYLKATLILWAIQKLSCLKYQTYSSRRIW